MVSIPFPLLICVHVHAAHVCVQELEKQERKHLGQQNTDPLSTLLCTKQMAAQTSYWLFLWDKQTDSVQGLKEIQATGLRGWMPCFKAWRSLLFTFIGSCRRASGSGYAKLIQSCLVDWNPPTWGMSGQGDTPFGPLTFEMSYFTSGVNSGGPLGLRKNHFFPRLRSLEDRWSAWETSSVGKEIVVQSWEPVFRYPTPIRRGRWRWVGGWGLLSR